jgi:TPR repeat protein
MILCKECGYEGVYEGKRCPQCRAELSLSAEETAKIEEDYRLAVSEGAYESAAELAHILADAGNSAAAAAYGRMLYEGDGVIENRSAAMEYLAFSASEGDAQGAFLYGKALSERGDAGGDFFLLYAALLGQGNAYPYAAEIFSSIGRDADAAAYLALAAGAGSRSAALSLARRYEKSDPSIAKWYLSKASPLPPHAWPLSLRLRRVEEKEPPMPVLPHVGALIAQLRAEADKKGLGKLCLNLTQMLATRGDMTAQCRLGEMYLEGYLGEADPKKGCDVLLYYGRSGNAEAYLVLAEAYLSGAYLPVSRADAIECYHAARRLGSAKACVRLGDIYASDENPNPSYAYLLYKEALALGSREGADKAHAIEERREGLYRQGKALLSTDAEDAYRNFALSASMGYAPAAVALGFCYEEGLGVSMDRRRAFLWYESAAKENEAMAIYRLGRAYFHGIGADRNFAMAHKLLRRAAAEGIEDAREELFEMLERRRRKMLRSLYSLGVRLLYQGKHEAARSMIERASSLGFSRATYVLGCFYEFGVAGAVNRDLAFATYRKAEEQGFADTRARCKSVILKILHLQSQRAEAAAR